jgi:hypothetical protein
MLGALFAGNRWPLVDSPGMAKRIHYVLHADFELPGYIELWDTTPEIPYLKDEIAFIRRALHRNTSGGRLRLQQSQRAAGQPG